MADKKRLRMRGVKHTSKRLEDQLLERSALLAENPGMLRPACAGNCRKCVFDKTFKSIDGLRKIIDNPDALIKEASRFGGDDIVRAYAGTVSLSAAGSIPLLATAKLPGGDPISYAVRGTVKADKLIGCQYFDDPKLRMFLYNDTVKKNKLHLYSFGDDVVCSDTPNMPEGYLEDTFSESPYNFPGEGYSCEHEAPVILEITVKSLNKTIRICENCAKSVSTLAYIVSRMSAADPLDDITVNVKHKYHKPGEMDLEEVTGENLKKYMVGLLTDALLISSVKRSKMGDFKEGDVSAFIIGSKNYGDSLGEFISALSGDEHEIDTLRSFLAEHPRAIAVKNPKASEALNAIWENDWKELIAAHTDMKTAESMGDVSHSQPLPVLMEAYSRFVTADVSAALPEFTRPGPVTSAADRLAKAYKAGGMEMLRKTAESKGLRDSKIRSVEASFLMACGEKDLPFRLSPSEKSLADYLVPFARSVVNSDAKGYADAMGTFLIASSSGEKIQL
ncbi:MAG: hypothetical protein J5494_06310 [Candidatus Methanomethylophilaceae archaeon]|nr:hypothetical protein [Candidatus Methanomethylophilaceae archaeon]